MVHLYIKDTCNQYSTSIYKGHGIVAVNFKIAKTSLEFFLKMIKKVFIILFQSWIKKDLSTGSHTQQYTSTSRVFIEQP